MIEIELFRVTCKNDLSEEELNEQEKLCSEPIDKRTVLKLGETMVEIPIKPKTVTLNEDEIIEACRFFLLEKRGIDSNSAIINIDRDELYVSVDILINEV